MKYNFDSIKLVNQNEILIKELKENKKFKNKFKKLVRKVINK